MKSELTFKKLLAAREEISRLADEVAKAEAKIVIAERKLTASGTDDGVTDAKTIVERADAARKELEISRIEGNRAAAKLAESESNFENLVKQSVAPVLGILSQKATAADTALREKIAPLIGDYAAKSHELNNLIRIAQPANDIRALILRLQLAADYCSGTGEFRPDLVSNLLAAEPYMD